MELFYNGRLGIGSSCFKMMGLEKQLKRETKDKGEKSGYEEATRDVKKKMSLIPGLWLNCCCRGKVLSENNEIRV